MIMQEYINLNIRIEKLSKKSGIANPPIPVNATIIIRIGLTILAFTAASPSTSAPIIPMVLLNEDETLSPASLSNSNDTSIIKISNITGNGIDSLELEIANNNSDGISS